LPSSPEVLRGSAKTGGASGIGKEVATRVVAAGGSLVINGRDADKAEAAAREIDPTGKRVVVHGALSDDPSPATSSLWRLPLMGNRTLVKGS
jgi:NAD(P)-dependent dehydrogenase (short-subunit alcohol dehydrogenase family)